MERISQEVSGDKYHWILFFYAVPSTPVSNRMKVWRKLMKAGAMPLKGAVYIMPFTHEHYEFLQWLVAEVSAMKGEAALVSIEKVDTIKDSEIVNLFNQARINDYLAVEKEVEAFIRKLHDIKKGGQGQDQKGLSGHLDKIFKSFAETRKIDFFNSPEGGALHEKLGRIKDELNSLMGAKANIDRPSTITRKSTAVYQGRVWVTRKRPFVDRMASAWLIKRYIDSEALFEFIEESEMDDIAPAAIVFDMGGGEFTHQGDLCTFEVLIKAFGLKDRGLKQIAEIVHDLDVKDEKYHSPEAAGLEGILSGIRKSAGQDSEALSQGMQVFEMLYVSKNS